MKIGVIPTWVRFGETGMQPWHVIKQDGTTPVASDGTIESVGNYTVIGRRKTNDAPFIATFSFQNSGPSKIVRCQLNAPSLPATFHCDDPFFKKQLTAFVCTELTSDAMTLCEEYDLHREQMRALQAVATFAKTPAESHLMKT